MAEGHEPPPYLDFELDPSSASKRPEQLVILLKRALEQEFPEAFATIEVYSLAAARGRFARCLSLGGSGGRLRRALLPSGFLGSSRDTSVGRL